MLTNATCPREVVQHLFEIFSAAPWNITNIEKLLYAPFSCYFICYDTIWYESYGTNQLASNEIESLSLMGINGLTFHNVTQPFRYE